MFGPVSGAALGTIVSPDGSVTSAEPICCVPVSFLSVIVYAWSVKPLGSDDFTTIEKSLPCFGAPCADPAKIPSIASVSSSRYRAGTGVHLRGTDFRANPLRGLRPGQTNVFKARGQPIQARSL
jgi:hypothetical protein